MNNLAPSLIRTFVPIVVTAVVTWLAAININLDPETVAALSTVIGAVIGGIYYTVVRVIERKVPWVGNFLGSAKKPVYIDPVAGKNPPVV